MNWTTVLGDFTDREDLKDFIREEPFSRLHTIIEAVHEDMLYVSVRTDQKHLRPLMTALLAYGAIPRILPPQESERGTVTVAFDTFASDLKEWMVQEKLGHDSIVGRCRAVMAYCDEMNAKETGSYYTELKKLVQQFLTLLTGEE